MFICAAWRKRIEGSMDNRRTLVNRCDLEEGHEGDHVDKVLLVNWPESESAPECRPRNEWNSPSAAELAKRVQTQQFDLARTIEQRNRAIGEESKYEKGQTIQTADNERYILTKVVGDIRPCPPYNPIALLIGYKVDDETQSTRRIYYPEDKLPTIIHEPAVLAT